MRFLLLLLLLVPTGSLLAEVCPKCGVDHAVQGTNQYVVNRDQRAYNHALREATILAQRGTAGHPLGCAPGTRYSGTGYSWTGRPTHCYLRELPTNRLVARAVVRGRNGAYYWSAHYR